MIRSNRKRDAERLRKALSTPPAEGASPATDTGPVLSEALTLPLTGLDRRIARRLAPLTDDEIRLACKVLGFSISPHPPHSLTELFYNVLLRRTHLLRYAEIITALMPAYRTLRRYDDHVEGTAISRTISWDTDTPAAWSWWKQFLPVGAFGDTQRLDMLHGWMMQEVADRNLAHADAEWFGRNRDRILPLWELLDRDMTFSRQRVAVMLENMDKNSVPVTLTGGAL